MSERIVLGSGQVYMAEFSGSIPADATLETTANKLGAVSGGATLEYSSESYTAISDDGTASKTILTKEEVKLKTGLCTFDANTLAKLCATARVTSTTTKRTLKIGGVGQQNGKKYVIRFVHEDAADGDIRVTVVGTNTAGLSIAFAKDKESVIGPEFTALPNDSDGTLVIYEEEIPSSSGSGGGST